MTSDYTFVSAERQNELTRLMQQKLSDAAKKLDSDSAGSRPAPETPSGGCSNLATAIPVTSLTQ